MHKDCDFSPSGMLQRLAVFVVPLLFVVVLVFPNAGYAQPRFTQDERAERRAERAERRAERAERRAERIKRRAGRGGTSVGNSVPELDPSQAGIGLLLTTGGVLVLTGRRIRKKK